MVCGGAFAPRQSYGRDNAVILVAIMNHVILSRLALLGLLALTMSACGRAGPLEPPPASAASAQRVADGDQPVDDRPFVLDGLLN